MIVEMRSGATREMVDAVIQRAESYGLETQLNVGTDKYVVALLGSNTGQVPTEVFEVLQGVASVTRIMRPYKLASTEFIQNPTVVRVGNLEIGGNRVILMAGPCSIESRDQLWETAQFVHRHGASIIRGGAFKPRTSPFSFQGLGKEALQYLHQVHDNLNVPVISEITDPHQVDVMAEHVDILQVGARNMQNYALLRAVSESGKPCMLKRGLASTVTEWLQAADYLLAHNPDVILCERGIRTFETSTRFTLDIGAIGVVKRTSHLPVIVDPSHAAGHYELVPVLARAAVAAGADGLIIEVHPHPADAMSDGLQSLTFKHYAELVGQLEGIATSVGRTL